LGEHVEQRGSNITVERLRFDFSHPAKLTPEQRAKVESLVNEQIQKNLPVIWKEMSVEEAREAGAIGLFEERYGDRVKVYSIGSFSKEICGGPHVESTGDLGHFQIVKEQSIGAGMRRIRAILKDPC
jgi:alanyl-tRNA synthetase